MYKVEIAETKNEIDLAYELFYKSFGPNYHECKEFFDSTREDAPVFIIKDGNSIIASLRTVNRSLNLFGERFDIGGIATTVVHPNYRGLGLFNELTSSALNNMENRSLSMCLVFARKAIDNIYVKHGFWGVPVERMIKILNPIQIDNCLNFRTIQSEDIPFIEKIHNEVYKQQSVFLDRPLSSLENKIKQYKGYIFNNMGYVIIKDELIIEIGSHDIDTYNVILFSRNSPAKDKGFRISLEHPIMKTIYRYSYSIYTRHPNNGGHMLKILNEPKIMKIINSKGINIKMGISEITSSLFGYDTLKPIDFVFSPIDEF